jgi:DNA-binding beta-propeller fold protein YncE
MEQSLAVVLACVTLLSVHTGAQMTPVKAPAFQAVPELPYRVVRKYGTGIGEFNLPHTVAVDKQGRVYVGDRENQRIQIFDSEGNFIQQWTGIGYPYGLLITPDQHVWMVDGGYDRIVELDQNGKILGAFGEPGHKPGQMAWAHFMAMGPDQTLYVANVLNWRFDVFARTAPTGGMTKYIPSVRMFWG